MSRITTALTTLLVLAGHAAAQTEFQRFNGGAGEFAGHSVADAGDVDGDGFGDVIVGFPGHDVFTFIGVLEDAGKAVVYSGRTGETLLTLKGTAAGEQLGWSVDGVGDMDHDGFDDVAVGVPGAVVEFTFINPITLYGEVRVFSGVDGHSIWKRSGTDHESGWGETIAGLGDVDNDGFPDVAVGAPRYDIISILGIKLEAGQLTVLSGVAGADITALYGTQAGEHYGTSVALVGDVNLDGAPEIVIGAPDYDRTTIVTLADAGRVKVVTAATGAVIHENTGLSQAGGRYGAAVDGIGDINLDGRPDYLVGAPAFDANGLVNSGCAWAHSGIGGTILYTFAGTATGDATGTSVAGLGDASGDGRPDILIGIPYADPEGVASAGSARLFSGADGSSLASLDAKNSFLRFGSSVSSAGDVDGDGLTDMIVGAPGGPALPVVPGHAALFLAKDSDATWSNYGAALPGTIGVPLLTIDEDPVLCTSNTIRVSNSSGQSAVGMLFVGGASANLPTGYAGSLLVAPPWLTISLLIPPVGAALPFTMPCDAALSGNQFFMQALQNDPGAAKGVSFTQGMVLELGL